MNDREWQTFRRIVRREEESLHVGLIVDSPWIPGYCGHGFMDFYARPDIWRSDYLKIRADFPSVLFLPGWWVEMGMASEPSGFGLKLSFFDDNMPVVHPLISDADAAEAAVDALTVPDPKKDGLMPLLLNQQKYHLPFLTEIGEPPRIVSARGPFTLASHIYSLTELLVSVMTDPELTRKLLKKTTALCLRWLEAQLEVNPSAEGVLVLDDVCGFLSEELFREAALPWFQEIFGAFPGLVHLFHNDTVRADCYPCIREMGVDLFNFSHATDIGAVSRAVGEVALLGNVPTMALVNQAPEEVYAAARACIDSYAAVNGSVRGLLLSTGGGVPMGAKRENIEALVRAAEDYNAEKGLKR